MPMRPLTCCLLLALAAGPAAAGTTHEHGAARLDIAVDSTRLALALDTPLANLLGFEHAPANAAQRRAVEGALATLRDAARLIRPEAAAGCRLAAVRLRSAVLGLGDTPAAPPGEHADLEAEIEFDCQRAPTQLEQGLFDAFPRLQRLELQVVTPARQAGRTLRRPAARVPL